MHEPRFYEFGEFRLDAKERVLWRGSEMLVLPQKVFETLQALVKKSGHIVERDELMNEVWTDTFVEEGNLSVNISFLRKTLGKDVIETIPRRGYRFSAKVRLISDEEEQSGEIVDPSIATTIAAETSPLLNVVEPPLAKSVSSRNRVLLMFAAVFLIAAGIALFHFWKADRNQLANSIAVLPFQNVSGDQTTDYLSDGLSETLINKLSQLPQLKVIAQASAFQYKGKEIDPEEVGRTLNVQTLLTGRVAQRGDDLVINVELVDVRDRTQIWGEQYSRKLAGILPVQAEIAREVSARLRLRLAGEDRVRLTKDYTANPEAYQLYLKGRYFASKWNPEGFNKAVEHFNKAIALDPDYALAYAGLANCYVFVNWWEPWREMTAKGKTFAKRALELDNTLPEAHTTLAIISTWNDYDWTTAEQEFKRALELNSNYAPAHHWYGFYLLIRGRFDESIAEAKTAIALDPVSTESNSALGTYLFYAGRYEEALTQLRATADLDPDNWFTHLYLARALEKTGNLPAAIAELEKAKAMEGAASEVWAALGYAYAVAGQTNVARKIISELRQRSKQTYVPAYNFATIYAALGENDQAFAYLESEYAEGAYYLDYLKLDPELANLRDDPRFAQLVKRMNLAAP